MDPAWIAVVGTAIGATGATCAAAIAGRAARRQVKSQSVNQQAQWRRETRRDAYSAFLDAGVQARDELTAVWRLFRAPNPDLAEIDARLSAAEPFINSVKRSSATVFVEGPKAILEPTRRAEENITLFRTLLRRTLTDLRADPEALEHHSLCARQEHLVRNLLDRFAAFARATLDEVEPDWHLLKTDQFAVADEELRWLKKLISERLKMDEGLIQVKGTPVSQGLDSLDILVILHRIEEEWGIRPDGAWPISSFFDESIEDIAGYIAAQRNPPKA
ncbi:acyl carrier protein [Nonomuraea sp. NN258]|uniref:acyl carrier protein n=1 Tax=Nonomuraea antri TaxID=2730852 RepID=UPI00156A4526|nr:acyl carrier protein [Nonomuraea antri]NRQ35225.1 acyl carrier protein [Nonomuraea antri]